MPLGVRQAVASVCLQEPLTVLRDGHGHHGSSGQRAGHSVLASEADPAAPGSPRLQAFWVPSASGAAPTQTPLPASPGPFPHTSSSPQVTSWPLHDMIL